MRTTALIYVNGKRTEVAARQAGMMLADYLREELRLTGTKIVCAEGDCGACTVLRSFAGQPFLPINSCIVTVAQMDGSSLVTVDALAEGEELSPVQSAMRTCHGSQCGFCTPGFVMALAGLVEKRLGRDDHSPIREAEAKNALTGNLCRCTGYQPIIDAAVAIDLSKCRTAADRFLSRPQVRELRTAVQKPLVLECDGFRFLAPTTIKAAIKELKSKRAARLLGAATDLGVFHNKWRSRLNHVVSLHLIPELYEIKPVDGGKKLSVGARATLSELRAATKERVPEFSRFLDLFASPQIKNIATLIGNVANASPIADTPPFLLVSDAEVEAVGAAGRRLIPIEKFFLGYRKTALKTGEIIAAIRFAIPAAGESLQLRKVSERKDLDISSVNAAFRVSWNGKGRIAEARVAFGGVGPTALRLIKTENLLNGAELSADLMDRAARSLQDEIAPISDVRGSQAFRRVLAENLFRRFFEEQMP